MTRLPEDIIPAWAVVVGFALIVMLTVAGCIGVVVGVGRS